MSSFDQATAHAIARCNQEFGLVNVNHDQPMMMLPIANPFVTAPLWERYAISLSGRGGRTIGTKRRAGSISGLPRIRRLCIFGTAIGILLLLFASRAAAGPFEEGLLAYERGDYQSALGIWRPLAEKGDAAAQFNIGLLHDTGQGIAEDAGAAAHWYRLAADQSYAKAQLNLGDLYASGRGVPQDFLQAAELYEEAAKQRNANARYKLGYLYHHGSGVSQDLKEAIRLYQQAADQGLAEAQLMLGIMYSLGEAVPQDLQTAYVWLSLAMVFGSSDEGRAKAKTSLEIIEAKMKPEQIAMARQRASEWKPRVSP